MGRWGDGEQKMAEKIEGSIKEKEFD